MTAEEYYIKGNEYRQKGNYQEALNHYRAAIELAAVHAKEMLESIMNYYCKDFYNP